VKEKVAAGIERREYGRRDPSFKSRGTFCPQKLALISPKSGSRSVGIVRSRTQAMELLIILPCILMLLCLNSTSTPSGLYMYLLL
jgi:hypothetical protein